MTGSLRAKNQYCLLVGLSAVLAAGAFVMQRPVLEAELLGYDSYALILTSRIQSVSDLLGTFTEVMMDGRLAAGVFYRPIGNLLLAADYAAWGLDPFGYQLTSLLIWCATVLVMPLLVCRVLGRTAWAAAGVAALFYALHPASLSVLPYVERRPETIVLLFSTAALCFLPRVPDGGGYRSYLLPGFVAVLALASKESGILCVGLIFLHQAFAGSARGTRAAFRAGVRAAAPAAMLSGLFLGLRFAVVGGIGGYYEAKAQPIVNKLVSWVPAYVMTTLRSEGFATTWLHLTVPLAGLALLTALALCLLRLRLRDGGEDLQRIPMLLALGVAWLLAQAVLACASLHFTASYLLGMCFAEALAIGALAEYAVVLFRRGGHPNRLKGAIALVVVLGVCLLALRGSPTVRAYPELARASRIQEQLLSAAALRIESTQPYDYIDIKLPRNVPVDSYGVDSVWMISHWSLQAWLDLTIPERRYKVILAKPGGAYDPDFAAVILSPVHTAVP